jgi:hypothetical protein
VPTLGQAAIDLRKPADRPTRQLGCRTRSLRWRGGGCPTRTRRSRPGSRGRSARANQAPPSTRLRKRGASRTRHLRRRPERVWSRLRENAPGGRDQAQRARSGASRKLSTWAVNSQGSAASRRTPSSTCQVNLGGPAQVRGWKGLRRGGGKGCGGRQTEWVAVEVGAERGEPSRRREGKPGRAGGVEEGEERAEVAGAGRRGGSNGSGGCRLDECVVEVRRCAAVGSRVGALAREGSCLV